MYQRDFIRFGRGVCLSGHDTSKPVNLHEWVDTRVGYRDGSYHSEVNTFSQ